jgi:FtsH-binding integral membrane protein
MPVAKQIQFRIQTGSIEYRSSHLRTETPIMKLKHLTLALIALAWANGVALAQNQGGNPGDACGAAGGCGACGGLGILAILIPIAVIVLNVALLIWVAKDAKARGLDNSVMWMILVMFTGVLGLVIYIFSRPQGDLVQCPNCKNNRMQASARCPHCGNP